MRNRLIGFACVLGLSLLTAGCYNNPDMNGRVPGVGSDHIHGAPQVGPGTTAGGSTAGPQRPAKHEGKAEAQPAHTGVAADSPGLDHAGAANPPAQAGAQHGAATPEGAQSRTGNEKGVGDRSADSTTHAPAKR